MSARPSHREGIPAPARNRLYTVLLVGEHSQAIRKFHLRGAWLRNGAVALGAFALAGMIAGGHYVSLLGVASDNRALKEENAQLRSQILLFQEKVAHISATLDQVERFDAKLRDGLTKLQDPERSLPIGPVGKPRAGAVPSPAAAAHENLSALPAKLATLDGEASRQESSLREVQEYFDDQTSLLSSTPSLWPTRGWVTSDFGVRLDPYSAERMMHRGLDIATPYGQPIYAPSDGVVAFVGSERGYGKELVLDHGYGVKTRYGHLSEVFVKQGETVRRGARVAAVGNSGRSTGPHLHYEVRVNGIPENPRKFILE